ncbi:MAG: SIS domain-containing protein [Spirochaetaceae bacterium]|nr:MAG: SIS domain-containing protein [Spirochaetaceae bacterium]
MNLKNAEYSRYKLVQEMMQTPDVIRRFDAKAAKEFVPALKTAGRLFLTGEGSSRIFPAKRAIYDGLKKADALSIATDGATQALEYDLSAYAIFGASNSGKTKEVVRLFQKLREAGHRALFALTAYEDSPLDQLAAVSHILISGKEEAVAATKTVVEQALFYDSLLRALRGEPMADLEDLADKVEEALTAAIDPRLVEWAKNASTIYFAGRNTGVAEELTLKTNEITRKKADFLEGTYAVHGIEEVMDAQEVVVVVHPFESEEQKFRECLIDGVGLEVLAISTRKTSFPTMVIPDAGDYQSYVEIAAGWNLLVEIGIALGINLDKPQRARKVGNIYQGN